MVKPVQFHIDKINGSYLFKVQHPVLAQLKSFKRLDVNDLRQNIIKQVNKIRENIFEELPDEQMHNDLLSIGISIQKLIGIDCADILSDLLERHPSLLFLTDDPYIPWELISINNEPACLSNSIGRIITGGEIKIDYKKVEKKVIQILFIADPLGDLPSAKEEIQNILKELKPAIDTGYIEPIILEGNDATTSKIMEIMKKIEIEVIHYAGHAFFNDATPEESGLVLSDKVLTANVLSKTLNYVPEIIFVNACESAATISNYDKVAGIAQGFVEAGIKIFIGSLWPIDDRDAASFSYSFYHNLLQEKTIGECILASKKELYNNLKSAYGWASFILYGNPNEVPYLFNQEFKNNVEKSVLSTISEPIKLRFKESVSLLNPVKIDPEHKIISMGVEEEILKIIQTEEFNIILGPAGIGKTNCKYLLSQNKDDIYLVEFNKNYLKGIKNSESLLKIRSELETLTKDHKFVVLVIDEELYYSDLQAKNFIEIVGLLFPSGKPAELAPNLRLLLFLRTKSFKDLWKEGKVPAHWRLQQIWLQGIKLNDKSMKRFLSIHNLSKDNFTNPAYNLLKQKISSRSWIYPIFADKLLLFLEKNYKDQFSTNDIEEIYISDELIESIRNLVYKIRPSEQQKIWNCIVKLNKTYKLNPTLWLIKTTLRKLNTEIPDLKENLAELMKEKLLIEEKDEILGNIYLFSHDVYYDIVTEEFDEEFSLDLIESIEEELNKNLSKIKAIKNPKKLEMYLNLILQRFYFLSVNPYGSPAEYIDEVLEYFNNLEPKALSKIIPYLELLVLDFYARNQIESIAKLYFFIGDYYVKIDNVHPATDFYNMGCHIFESQGKDSTEYRIKNGNIYDTRIIKELDMNKFDSQTTVELASWQWKASKQYDKGIKTRKILVDTFLKINNKPWAAAELQWCGEVAELKGQPEEAINYYKEAIKLLEPEKHHIFNLIDYLSRVSIILDQLNRNKERMEVDSKIKDLKNKVNQLIKPDGKKIFILSGGGDLFPANQIYYKILQEINTDVIIKDEGPTGKYDIIIIFGSPLTPKVGPLIFNYMDREIINKMLSSSGYWIKKPIHEGDPLIIAIAGYTMFHTRAEGERFIEKESFQELIKLL
ncbi:MAG: CHAT domain-containing protein [Promethearchaeota archaeon]